MLNHKGLRIGFVIFVALTAIVWIKRPNNLQSHLKRANLHLSQTGKVTVPFTHVSNAAGYYALGVGDGRAMRKAVLAAGYKPYGYGPGSGIEIYLHDTLPFMARPMVVIDWRTPQTTVIVDPDQHLR